MSATPLFVYGTLMSDQRAFHRLADAVTRSAPARLPDADLYVVSWYPIAVPGAGQIHGEVHWLAADASHRVLAQLDEYEGDEYVRAVRRVTLADGDEVEAWVYLGDAAAAHGLAHLNHGDWRRFHGD